MSEDDRGSLWAGGDADRAEPPPRPFQRAEQAAEAPDDAPAGRLPPAPHADRFRFVLGALAGLAVAAVVAAVLLAGRSDGGPDGGWSAWKPTADGTRGAEQIASYVGASYRGKGGKQLVAVKAGPLKVADLDLNVALEGANGQIQVFQGEGLRYTMCGLGPNCSMAEGKPTLQRGLLLQREALELALYSFQYLPGIDQVVAFLPPRPGEEPTQGKALYFNKDSVEGPLGEPLASTLPSPPPLADSLRARDLNTIQQLAGRSVHCFSYRVGQDVSAFLVLSPPAATCQGGTG